MCFHWQTSRETGYVALLRAALACRCMLCKLHLHGHAAGWHGTSAARALPWNTERCRGVPSRMP